MNVWIVWCRRQTARLIACAVALLLAASVCQASTDKLPNKLPNAPQPNTQTAQSPAQDQNQPQGQNQNNAAPQQQNNAGSGQSSSSSSSSQQPVGTAVAPLIKPVGVAASRPAGAAIAPAKQRRIRVLAIRWGLIVGGAIALGTVAGATMASPRRPN